MVLISGDDVDQAAMKKGSTTPRVTNGWTYQCENLYVDSCNLIQTYYNHNINN